MAGYIDGTDDTDGTDATGCVTRVGSRVGTRWIFANCTEVAASGAIMAVLTVATVNMVVVAWISLPTNGASPFLGGAEVGRGGLQK